MKGMSFGKGTGYKSPQLMKKEAAMKMKKNSPMDKPLVGDQHKLPEHLKQKIEAAPTKLRSAISKLSRKAGKKIGEVTKKSITSEAKKLPGGTREVSRKKMSSPNKIAKRAAGDSLGGVIKRRRSEQGKRVKAERRSNSSDPFKITGAVAEGAKDAMKNKLLKDNPPGSAGRKAAYDKLGYKYDDTVPGYNRDGTKKSTMTDPKKTDITGDKEDRKADYTTASTKGRKTTVVKTKGDKTAALVDTKRNIGDKRVVNITGPKGDVRTKTKFDTAGEQTKKKRKITLPDGTVVKIKSKRGGKRKVKIRKKGQLFGKRDRAREARLNEDLSMQPKN